MVNGLVTACHKPSPAMRAPNTGPSHCGSKGATEHFHTYQCILGTVHKSDPMPNGVCIVPAVVHLASGGATQDIEF